VHEVRLEEIEQFAHAHVLVIVHTSTARDSSGRPEVTWTQVALRLSDDRS
jgi:hypothetical protein